MDQKILADLPYASPETVNPVRSTRIRRVWDIVVGATMILAGSLFAAFLAGLIALAIAAALPASISGDRWVGAAFFCVLFVVVNIAAFLDYRRLRRINSVYSTAGRIHLVPRGWNRILFGRE